MNILLFKTRNNKLTIRRHRLLMRDQERKLQPKVKEFMDYMTKKLKAGIPKMRGKTATKKAKSIADWDEIRTHGEELLKPALFGILEAGGNSVMGQRIQKQDRFDPIGIEAIDWANAHSAELVAEITQESMMGIRDVIATGINAGKSMPTIARELRPVVGLHSQYAEAVGNYHTSLIAEGVAASKAAAKAETYAGQLHRRRTTTIARTETAFGLTEGQRQGYGQMGIKNLERVEDPECCDICAEYNGKIYSVKEAEGVLPEHPNCEGTWVVAAGEVVTGIPERVPPAPRLPPGTEKWKLATNTDEAEKFALKNIVTEGGAVGYEKMALEGINIMNRELSMLINKFKRKPDFIGSWKGLKKHIEPLYGDRWRWMKRSFRLPTGAWAAYMEIPIKAGLRITAIVARDEWFTKFGLQKLKTSLATTMEKGFHKAATMKSIFDHEYAHLLDYSLGISRNEIFRMKYREMVRAGQIKEKISGYAASDLKEEAWAELYANYKDGFYLRTNQPEMQYFAETIVKFMEAGV